jgi:hypothetical protein
MGHKLMYDTAYFGGEEGLREAYVKYAQVVLEPKQLVTNELLESRLQERIDGLANTIRILRDEYNKLLDQSIGRIPKLETDSKIREALLEKYIKELEQRTRTQTT